MTSPLNPAVVLVVTFEYLSYLSLSERLRPPARRKVRGATIGVLYPGYRGPPVMTQKSRYDQFPSVVDNWGTKHPVSDMVPPLLAEEKGQAT
jgi:hypothetical protein